MVKIAVFDSGLGSLSIIKEIQKITKSEIIYFADQKIILMERNLRLNYIQLFKKQSNF